MLGYNDLNSSTCGYAGHNLVRVVLLVVAVVVVLRTKPEKCSFLSLPADFFPSVAPSGKCSKHFYEPFENLVSLMEPYKSYLTL